MLARLPQCAWHRDCPIVSALGIGGHCLHLLEPPPLPPLSSTGLVPAGVVSHGCLWVLSGCSSGACGASPPPPPPPPTSTHHQLTVTIPTPSLSPPLLPLPGVAAGTGACSDIVSGSAGGMGCGCACLCTLGSRLCRCGVLCPGCVPPVAPPPSQTQAVSLGPGGLEFVGLDWSPTPSTLIMSPTPCFLPPQATSMDLGMKCLCTRLTDALL